MQLGRRRFLWLLGGTAAGAGLLHRLAFYEGLPGFSGEVLSEREAAILMAVAEVVAPPGPPSLLEIAAAVDRFVQAVPSPTRRELHALFAFVEQAIVAARRTLVDGAVGMVEMALASLSEKDVVHLDDERRAAMVSNLMVVLCGERDTQPVVNTGTLYQ